MNARTRWMRTVLILAVGAIGLAFTAKMFAQVQTTKTETAGASTQEVTVERATVISVAGNDLFVRMEDGSIRHIADVPESARVTVDGKELGIHELKPGMRLQRAVTTTTTPKVITTTQTLTGKVWHVAPPSSVVLTLENGENQQFKIPKGQKFNIEGQMTDAWGLKKGMRVSVTKVVEEPITQIEQEAKLSGHMPPAPPSPPADTPILVAIGTPTPAPAQAEAQAEATAPELPSTASNLPLIGLIGLILIMAALGVRMIRKAHVH